MPAPFQLGGGTGPASLKHSEYRTPSVFRGSGQDSNRDSKGELHDSIVADATTHYPTGKPRMLMTSDQIIPE